MDISQIPEKRGLALKCEYTCSDHMDLWVRSRGGTQVDLAGGDGMSMFGGRLLAAATIGRLFIVCSLADVAGRNKLLSAMSGAPTPEMGIVGQFRSVP